ncbi:hypothetical protein JCM10207_005555 [Rhodosporidiobolus poonsookiae]
MESATAHPKIRNRFTTLTVLFAALGSLSYGYSSGIISSALNQPSFTSYIGLDTASDANGLSGAITGVFQGCGLLGSLKSGWSSDKFGRRKAIFYACIIVIIGSILQCAAVHIAMFIIGRGITGFGVGELLALVPCWQSEVADARSRGFLVGMHGKCVFILTGYAISGWLGVAFYYCDAGGAEWRVPLAIQILWPLLLGAGIFLVPESPRWLLQQGRFDEALAVCKLLRQTPSDPDSLIAHAEFDQIKAQYEYDLTQPSSWWSIFKVPSYRKRAIIGFLTTGFAQGTGTLVIANYGPIIYALLGFSQSQKLILSAGWFSLAVPMNGLAALIQDRFGRVKMMTVGMITTEMALVGAAITFALGTQTGDSRILGAAVFFVYACGLDDPTYVYISEIWPNHIRSKGIAISTSGLWFVSLILNAAAASAFDNIGWKYLLPLIGVTAVGCVVIPLYWPEVCSAPFACGAH